MRRQLLYHILSLMGLFIISPLLVFAHGEALEELVSLFSRFGLLCLIWRIPKSIALWKVFKNAGEAGWKAIIPFYDGYIMFKIAGIKNWFWYMIVIWILAYVLISFLPYYRGSFIFLLVVIFSFMVLIVMHFMFAKKYGWRDTTSMLFAVFYPICILILGFGNYKYQGKSDKTAVDA